MVKLSALLPLLRQREGAPASVGSAHPPGLASAPTAPPASAGAPADDAAAPAADPARLDHLFRHAAQAGVRHPLHTLLTRYRAGDRA